MKVVYFGIVAVIMIGGALYNVERNGGSAAAASGAWLFATLKYGAIVGVGCLLVAGWQRITARRESIEKDRNPSRNL